MSWPDGLVIWGAQGTTPASNAFPHVFAGSGTLTLRQERRVERNHLWRSGLQSRKTGGGRGKLREISQGYALRSQSIGQLQPHSRGRQWCSKDEKGHWGHRKQESRENSQTPTNASNQNVKTSHRSGHSSAVKCSRYPRTCQRRDPKPCRRQTARATSDPTVHYYHCFTDLVIIKIYSHLLCPLPYISFCISEFPFGIIFLFLKSTL